LQEEHTVLKLEDRLQQMQESMDKLQSTEQAAKQTSS